MISINNQPESKYVFLIITFVIGIYVVRILTQCIKFEIRYHRWKKLMERHEKDWDAVHWLNEQHQHNLCRQIPYPKIPKL
jgi:endonuclease III-like uncharacterized protein